MIELNLETYTMSWWTLTLNSCITSVCVCPLQEEFIDNPLPGFADAGIIFVIHSPKKEPQFDGLGLSSPVGMHSRVTIRQVKVRTWEMWREESISW